MSTEKKSKKENKEEISYKEVVRIFLLQTISHNEISDIIQNEEDIKSLSFTRTVLIQKSANANNPNQLMPIGGNINKGETPESAAKREALEETHLIFSNLIKLDAEQTYTFMHNGKKAGRKSCFFLGNLFAQPFDKPYPLNEEVDKIQQFVNLKPNELKELFTSGSLQDYTLLDSLNPNEKTRKKAKTKADNNEIQTIQSELLEKVKLAEIKKKIDVLIILNSRGFNKVENKKVSDALDLLKVKLDLANSKNAIEELFTEVDTFWRENIMSLCVNKDNLREAIRFSNLQDMLQDIEIPEDKIGNEIPTIHMMFPIMFGFNFDKKLLPLLLNNKHLKKLYTMSRILYFHNELLESEDEKRKERIKKILNSIFSKLGLEDQKSFNDKNLIELFKRFSFLSSDFETSFTILGSEVDNLFTILQDQGKIDPKQFTLSHVNEVQAKDFNRIVKLAFGPESNAKEKRVKFEAQRKLLLSMLLFEAKKYYTSILEVGVTQLDDLEESLEISNDDADLNQESTRVIRLGEELYPVIIERRTKSLISLLRKVLVRDDWNFESDSSYNDTFAETYVFREVSEEKMKSKTYDTPCKMTDGKNREMTELKTQGVVYDLINELVTKAKNSDLGELEILQFKALSEEGKIIESAGLGGGAKIRLCKFYLKFTNKEGVTMIREVQVFLPKKVNGEWVSGEVDYDYKKKDDERYALARLFTHGNIYSIVELLFPYKIYGDSVKELFKANI